jgi:hypothetical protein
MAAWRRASLGFSERSSDRPLIASKRTFSL